jgi:asparagine synthetase B (glutamine-hydrolysing)
MYAFLFAAGERAVRQLTRASKITDELMPKVGARRICEVARFDGLNADWFRFCSDPPADEQFMTDERTDQHFVLAYGEVYGFSSAAAEVLRAWRTGGLEAVRSLDGSFSAILVDRASGAVHVVSDLVGRRTLRWFADRDAFLVSSHDLPIVATGLCPPEIDLGTAATILSTGWSLQGRSLLRNVRRCSPHHLVAWDGEINELYRPLVALDSRLDERDQLGQEKLREEMIELTRLHARHVCGDRERIFSDLTAGFDSRAGLAVLLSTVKATQLVLQTSGGASNLEVMVAGRIAEHYGLTHKIAAPRLSDRAAFWENCKVRAFFLNGDTDAKRSLRVHAG